MCRRCSTIPTIWRARWCWRSATSDPILSRMYATHWTIIPNLGTDLVLPPLLHVLPVHLAGRIVVGIAILLPVIGTIAYSRAMFGTLSAWPLASGLVAYNATLLLGFLNFVAAIGIALLLAAAWIAWRERHPLRTVALATIGTVALFFCHLMGLVFFCAADRRIRTGAALARRARSAGHLARASPRCCRWSPCRLSSTCVSPLAPLRRRNRIRRRWPTRHGNCCLPFANYILPLDIVTACMVGAFLLACVATRRCRITLGARRRAVADGAAVSGRALGVQGHLLSRHTLRDHAGLPAVRRGAAARACHVPHLPPSPPSRCCSPSAWRSSRSPGMEHRHDLADTALRHRHGGTRRTRVRRLGVAGGSTRLLAERPLSRHAVQRHPARLPPAGAAADRAPRLLAVPVRQSVAAAGRDAAAVSRTRRACRLDRRHRALAAAGQGRSVRLRLPAAARSGRRARPRALRAGSTGACSRARTIAALFRVTPAACAS